MDYSQELIRAGRDAGSRVLWCWGEAVQGYVMRMRGNLQDAIAHQQEAIQLAEAIPDYVYHIIASVELGPCYLRQEDLTAALSALETCRQTAADHHVIEPFGLVMTLNNTAEAYLFAVEHVDADERAAWLSKAKVACRAALKQAPKCRSKWPKALRLQGTYKWLRGKPTDGQMWWQKSLSEAERMGLRYDEGMTHFEMCHRLGERAHLEKAEAIFAEIGAGLDLDRTRNLLRN